jgi:hypothetical protein
MNVIDGGADAEDRPWKPIQLPGRRRGTFPDMRGNA